MSRTQIYFQSSNDQLNYKNICDILQYNNFRYVFEKNEYVWKWGTGFLTAIKYIKLEFPCPGQILIHAWIRPLLFPEMKLDNGFFGLIPKQELQSIITIISQYIV